MSVTSRCLIVALAALVAGSEAAAQSTLASAKELYASAAYDEALSALAVVKIGANEEVALIADQYVAFCMVALGRNGDAEAIIDSIVRRDPLVQLDAKDVSPRIDALFTQARHKVLPGLIRERYRAARDAMNQSDAASGLKQLGDVRRLLDSAKEFALWDDTLADMSVLVDGFLDLNRAATARPPSPPAEALKTPPAAAGSPTPTAKPAAAKPAPATTTAARPSVPTYSGMNADVTAPVIVRQDIPEVRLDSPTRGTRRSGVLAVTIDERGAVVEAVMRESISAAVDAQLQKAARSWQYEPARKDGVPVRYIKMVGIAIDN